MERIKEIGTVAPQPGTDRQEIALGIERSVPYPIHMRIVTYADPDSAYAGSTRPLDDKLVLLTPDEARRLSALLAVAAGEGSKVVSGFADSKEE